MGWALPEHPGEPVEHVPTEWTFPARVLEGAARLVPLWESVGERLTRDNVFLSAGQYTCTPDSMPIIGPYEPIPGLYFNLGYSGHGIMGSPGGARLLADLIVHPGSTENPFRYGRFAAAAREHRAEKMVI